MWAGQGTEMKTSFMTTIPLGLPLHTHTREHTHINTRPYDQYRRASLESPRWQQITPVYRPSINMKSTLLPKQSVAAAVTHLVCFLVKCLDHDFVSGLVDAVHRRLQLHQVSQPRSHTLADLAWAAHKLSLLQRTAWGQGTLEIRGQSGICEVAMVTRGL